MRSMPRGEYKETGLMLCCTQRMKETEVEAQEGKERNEQARSNQLRRKPPSGEFNRVLS